MYNVHLCTQFFFHNVKMQKMDMEVNKAKL